MSIFKKLAKAGVAKKLITEARKPHNQQKAKDALGRLRGRGGPSGRPSGSRARGRAR